MKLPSADMSHIGPRNDDLEPSGDNPLPEPMWTQIYDVI